MGSGDTVEVLIWSAQLALLQKQDFPCSAQILASAERLEDCDEGDVLLRGSRSDFERLAGFVAGEANQFARDRRATRKAALWGDLSERIECAL